jgi:hypothetical protein
MKGHAASSIAQYPNQVWIETEHRHWCLRVAVHSCCNCFVTRLQLAEHQPRVKDTALLQCLHGAAVVDWWGSWAQIHYHLLRHPLDPLLH